MTGTPKKPTTRKAAAPKAPSKVNVPPNFMRVERWSGKTWRGQRFYLRVTDTRNGEKLVASEPYARSTDRDTLFNRFVALGMEPLDIE